MTDVDEITIFDEIVNCGIMEEDSVVNFGAGCGGGKFLDTLMEYNGSFGENPITAVDPDSKKNKNSIKEVQRTKSINRRKFNSIFYRRY